MAPLGARQERPVARLDASHGNLPAERPKEGRTVASDIGFSGPGKANTEARSGKSVALPKFFAGGKSPEDEITPETVETPRERAVRIDAQEALGQSEASAPKL